MPDPWKRPGAKMVVHTVYGDVIATYLGKVSVPSGRDVFVDNGENLNKSPERRPSPFRMMRVFQSADGTFFEFFPKEILHVEVLK